MPAMTVPISWDMKFTRCMPMTNTIIGVNVASMAQSVYEFPNALSMTTASNTCAAENPYHLMQRTNDSVYSIMAQYQTEYLGVVQYYRLAYNLHQLGRLKWVMQQSLVRTLAKKLKISMAQVYKRFKATHQNEYGTYKVLEARLKKGSWSASLDGSLWRYSPALQQMGIHQRCTDNSHLEWTQ